MENPLTHRFGCQAIVTLSRVTRAIHCVAQLDFGDALWKTWNREGWITSEECRPFTVAKYLERRIELTSIIARSILCLGQPLAIVHVAE